MAAVSDPRARHSDDEFPSFRASYLRGPAQHSLGNRLLRRARRVCIRGAGHRELEHLVISDSLSSETGPWREKTRIVRGDEAGRNRPGQEGERGALVALGSLMTWNGLLAAGLVDELHMMIGPGVLDDGVPAFSLRPPGAMRLTGARQLGDSNIALLLYSLG